MIANNTKMKQIVTQIHTACSRHRVHVVLMKKISLTKNATSPLFAMAGVKMAVEIIYQTVCKTPVVATPCVVILPLVTIYAVGGREMCLTNVCQDLYQKLHKWASKVSSHAATVFLVKSMVNLLLHAM